MIRQTNVLKTLQLRLLTRDQLITHILVVEKANPLLVSFSPHMSHRANTLTAAAPNSRPHGIMYTDRHTNLSTDGWRRILQLCFEERKNYLSL